LRRVQGQAIVRLSISADGRIGSATVATSSGHSLLDDASLDTIRRAAPLPAPEGGPVELLVPIVFALRDQ
jgi:protein TonB